MNNFNIEGKSLGVIGVIVIGRNESKRLPLCFESMRLVECLKVYVDSGSSDNSVELAKEYQLDVVELDSSHPFSAARARNEGFERLMQLNPNVEFVQFIDGDCTLLPGWLDVATKALLADKQRGAVIGHLQERNMEASPYNRLCALEWRSAVGDLDDYGALGGISVIRASVFKELGGFNPEVIAGEDSEFGVRMGAVGYKVTKLDCPMATHDADIHHFSQWWTRAVRAGHAIGQRAFINGKKTQDCVKERNSTFFWGGLIPFIVVLLLIPSDGYSLLLLGGYGLLCYRVIRFRLTLGDSYTDAWLYTKFLLLAKFANMVGLLKFYSNKLYQHYEIIEYK